MLTVSKKLGPPECAIAMAVPPEVNLRTPMPPARRNGVRGGGNRSEAVSSPAADRHAGSCSRPDRRDEETSMEREKLADLVVRFTQAFNRDDLDGVMSFMADDAVYDEFSGTVNRGAAAIRAAFVPQFRGDYGKIRFNTEDLFVDADAGKALIRWQCTLETKRGPAAWRGLDIIHVVDGRITEKLTYAKAKVPLLGEIA